MEKHLINSVDATSNVTTASIPLGDRTHYSAQADFSGSTLAGTFKVQVSNNETTWIDLSSTNVTGATSVVINTSDAGYKWCRYVWTFSSGSGNIDIYFFSKDVNFKYR